MEKTAPKIALVHDSFTQLGGAERVFEHIREVFPQATVFTLVIEKKLRARYAHWNIKTSWLQKVYNLYPRFPHLLPLIPLAVSCMDFSGYDLIISSSSSFVKNIRVPAGARHICYCHTPTRFLWVDGEYINQEVPAGLRWLARMFFGFLKKWDYAGAQRVTKFIANSREVQKRIKKIYGRESSVVYPGVDTDFWRPTAAKKNYFLIAGRLQAHKKNDLIIKIFSRLGLPLHVAGTGRQENYLKTISKPNIKFLGRISDEFLRDEYSGALGFIYPQIEDFGLMPLEAAACGTPTLGYAAGGNLETIIPGRTGELFVDYGDEAIMQIIRDWNPDKYSIGALQDQAAAFGKKFFEKNFFAAAGIE